MARVKKAMNARKKHKKVLKLAKGFIGSRSKLYRPANTFVMKALKNAYIGRKLKKRDFRRLWNKSSWIILLKIHERIKISWC